MHSISKIFTDQPSRWQREALYSAIYDRWEALDAANLRSSAQRETEGRWGFRNVRPAMSTLPFLAGLGQTLLQRNPTSLNAGQSMSQGVSNMFLAHDRYRRKQLMADMKERWGKQQYEHGLTLDEIQDLSTRLHHASTMTVLISKILANAQSATRQIIENL